MQFRGARGAAGLWMALDGRAHVDPLTTVLVINDKGASTGAWGSS